MQTAKRGALAAFLQTARTKRIDIAMLATFFRDKIFLFLSIFL